MENTNETLQKKIDDLNARLDRQERLGYRIGRSILSGVFVSFGATLVFGTILIILAYSIKGAEQIPFLNEIIERTKLEQLVDNYNDVEVEGDLGETTPDETAPSQDGIIENSVEERTIN
ncbi:hypothetical protein JW978_03385 [Candidatus Dojkabacteria bacterium]|nr:hypothetical protein [Candidatus Dojkabacteria bacterium]